MQSQLTSASSKYGFLMTVHPVFGTCDLCCASIHWSRRRALLKFILSDHLLRIETARRDTNPIERQDRHCVSCFERGLVVLEDESHALDVCADFDSQRSLFRSRVSQCCSPGLTVTEIMRNIQRYNAPARQVIWRSLANLTFCIAEIRSKVFESPNS